MIVLVLIVSCNNKTSRKYETTVEDLYEHSIPVTMFTWSNEFQKYLDLIPFLKLPLSFECSNGFPSTDVDQNNDLVKKYKPDGASIIGRIYQDSSIVAILYGYPADIYYPIISLFDHNGQEMKNILLFEEGKCVGDEGYQAKTTGQITSDYKIKTKTFTYTWDPKNPNPIKDSIIVENIIEIK